VGDSCLLILAHLLNARGELLTFLPQSTQPKYGPSKRARRAWHWRASRTGCSISRLGFSSRRRLRISHGGFSVSFFILLCYDRTLMLWRQSSSACSASAPPLRHGSVTRRRRGRRSRRWRGCSLRFVICSFFSLGMGRNANAFTRVRQSPGTRSQARVCWTHGWRR
jgi:hypothetical protein